MPIIGAMPVLGTGQVTWPEHYSLMSLFSIARSPLMIGGDLLSTPVETTGTPFRNDEVLYVNQHSVNNRQVLRVDREIDANPENYYAIWIAEDPANGDYFVAMFNLSEREKDVGFELILEDLRGECKVRDLRARLDAGKAERVFKVRLPPHGAGLYRLSRVPGSSQAWAPPQE